MITDFRCTSIIKWNSSRKKQCSVTSTKMRASLNNRQRLCWCAAGGNSKTVTSDNFSFHQPVEERVVFQCRGFLVEFELTVQGRASFTCASVPLNDSTILDKWKLADSLLPNIYPFFFVADPTNDSRISSSYIDVRFVLIRIFDDERSIKSVNLKTNDRVRNPRNRNLWRKSRAGCEKIRKNPDGQKRGQQYNLYFHTREPVVS